MAFGNAILGDSGGSIVPYTSSPGYGADVAANASGYGEDQRLKGVLDANKRQLDAARLAANASQYGSAQQAGASRYASDQETSRQNSLLGWQRDRFGTVFPFFQTALSGAGGAPAPGGSPGGGPVRADGPPPAPAGGGSTGNYGYPPATTAAAPPPLSEGMIQGQVNASVARNDARSAGDLRRQQGELAGRGLGPSSPLARALEARIGGQNRATNADADRETRFNAAQLNAEDSRQRGIASQQADTQRFAAARAAAASEYGAGTSAAANRYASQLGFNESLNQQQVLREQIAGNSRNALLAALAGMLG